MDPPDPFNLSDGRPSPIRRAAELQGPRPAPLKVNKDSHKIKKPPIPPHPNHHFHSHQPPLPPPHPPLTAPKSQNPQPIIIYSISPKVIHTTVSDFMNLVQSLTGSSSTTATTTSGDVSPAARFASIENSSPSERERERLSSFNSAIVASTGASENQYEEITRILDENNYFSNGLENYIPSILSPAPAMLPPASPPGLFSPAALDPFILAASNMFIPSPSTLFSAPMVSPSPSSSPFNLFNSIFDF